ncbi:unnamed protein product [Ceutorhynchus assimilis]|uniref:CCHC-type domain-containing protein n=1 Tax=Ceutorhynchus assimilis TaxID=467358 RepID=A0A9N9MKE6_9CUCU|nr:unnamed protein product [Ceutorhynchus assimilis]
MPNEHENCNSPKENSESITEALRDQLENMRLQLEEQTKLNILHSIQQFKDSDGKSHEASAGHINLNDLQAIREILRKDEDILESIDPYVGANDYEAFIEAIENAATIKGWTEEETFRTMVKKLKGKAKEEFYALRKSERPENVYEISTWLRRLFGGKTEQIQAKRKLLTSVRLPDESLGAFVQRLRRVSTEAFPDEGTSQSQRIYREKVLVEQFIQGIDLRLANKIIEKGDFYTVEEVLAVAEKYENSISKQLPGNLYEDRYAAAIRVINEEATKGAVPKDCSERKQETRTPYNSYNKQQTQNGNNFRSRNFYPQRNNNFNQKPNRYQNPQGNQRNAGCYKCGDSNHLAVGCLKDKFPSRENVRKCYNCGKPGHLRAQCYLNYQGASDQSNK